MGYAGGPMESQCNPQKWKKETEGKVQVVKCEKDSPFSCWQKREKDTSQRMRVACKSWKGRGTVLPWSL